MTYVIELTDNNIKIMGLLNHCTKFQLVFMAVFFALMLSYMLHKYVNNKYVSNHHRTSQNNYMGNYADPFLESTLLLEKIHKIEDGTNKMTTTNVLDFDMLKGSLTDNINGEDIVLKHPAEINSFDFNNNYTLVHKEGGVVIHDYKKDISKIAKLDDYTSNENDNMYGEHDKFVELQNYSEFNHIIRNENVFVLESNFTQSFLMRLRNFNDYISQYRADILSKRAFKSWQDVEPPNKLQVLWGRDDGFINKLLSVPNIKLIVLPWIKYDTEFDGKNVLYPFYYNWSASDPLCRWIKMEKFTKAHWDAVYGKKCNKNIARGILPTKLEFMYFHSRPVNQLHYWPNDGLSYPSYYFNEPPPYALYLTVIQDAVINLVGDVITGSYKIVPFTCSHDNIPTIPIEYPESTVYKEVFIVTQFWGTSYFHKLIEVMPRLAPYRKFLKDNKQVLIHAPEERRQVSEMLNILGINSERIITGVVRAKVVYLPQGTPCGFPQVQGLQLLSHYMKLSLNKMQNNITVNTDNSNKNKAHKSLLPKQLLLIKRSGLRRFRQQKEIENAVKTFCGRNNLTFVLFDDNPVPSLPETMSIFHSSSFVVAPHGAGLANVMFCKQGSIIIEGVCNPPHVNMCYQFVSHVLGMRYHAIPSKSGCEGFIDINPQIIINVLQAFFDFDVPM
ncbi:hypothetical protein HELRODRAFT_193201 [Helobdella robusta]|uniref:Glycosyltransferase 61 catalytic domain-containing protein n=1 Tax=Helobdella robusta TaxID=6412 RepID=T1FUQ9_HELRO|nr:hypothetical protein HELRODRAFT_193201 [Helobdella robusta]ESN97794.1 hypothetical protein HELRODRAFT_193201 [Helobdella robusta]